MNRELIVRIIKDTNRLFTDLKKFPVNSKYDFHHTEKFYAVSMILFSIVNRAIGLGKEIITPKKLRLPNDYQDIFYLLKRDKIITDRLYQDFLSLIDFRNQVVHEFHTVKEDEIRIAFEKINAVGELIEVAKKMIQKEVKGNSKKK